MATRESNILFDDIFTVQDVDLEGKKFERVSRLTFNIELYPLRKGDVFTLALASSLSRQVVEVLEDAGDKQDYQYVMYGKVYKFDDGSDEVVTAYASFGGLLMALTGSYRHLQHIVIGENIYLLMRQ
ncbi:hypothetical protein BS47DRAFT_1372777 [Hydnum rufescens UP504]|uniref:DNA-directed RNA polymerases I, II, and III subunit RPABC3 n=1 Tax=Hydnum rufescens UP504 TaxID=1448309 RepID=A0A9P6DSY1_9AGAM|nr:hypothetical protein BS47DRAFT_1372777 [Hydnum rufescens UP504]